MHNATNEMSFAKIAIKEIVNPSASIIDHATTCIILKDNICTFIAEQLCTYFCLNIEFFQKFVLHNADVSKQIDEKRMGSIKNHTKRKHVEHCITSIATNDFTQIFNP